MRALGYLLTVAALTALPLAGAPGAAAAAGLPGAAPAAAHAQLVDAAVPAGVTAGYVVFDRQTNAVTAQQNADMQFRSASVVKLLIALDYLWDRGPTYAIPAADRPTLDAMLRSSNDSAAGQFWAAAGKRSVISRMAPRLGLQHTAPPSAAEENTWGYTAITPADTVLIYRYLLDTAPAPVRDYVMGNLRQSTRCGSDGFDQSFGIPSAFERPWAVKQGWAGFAATEKATASLRPPPWRRPGGGLVGRHGRRVDLTRPALHTTGTVGEQDRTIVAIFTLQPVGTSFGTAANTLTT